MVFGLEKVLPWFGWLNLQQLQQAYQEGEKEERREAQAMCSIRGRTVEFCMCCALVFALTSVRYKEHAGFCFLGSPESQAWGKSLCLSTLLGSIILGSRSRRYTGLAKQERGCIVKWSMAMHTWLVLHPMGPLEEMYGLFQDLICQLLSPLGWRAPHVVCNSSCISGLCIDGSSAGPGLLHAFGQHCSKWGLWMTNCQ